VEKNGFRQLLAKCLTARFANLCLGVVRDNRPITSTDAPVGTWVLTPRMSGREGSNEPQRVTGNRPRGRRQLKTR